MLRFYQGPAAVKACGLLRKDAAMAEKDTDIQKIKQLIAIMKENELVELEIKHDDDKIFLKRAQSQQNFTAMPGMWPAHGVVPVAAHGAEATAQPGTAKAVAAKEDLIDIKSPIVGTFYATPSPDSEPYVEVGTSVGPQTVVCIIEAMKVMNEIKAETSGTVVEVLVTNGQAVEYGQVLYRLKPD
jgi:acetyl-CoA carboxylase biotin carboxyl carrier protein